MSDKYNLEYAHVCIRRELYDELKEIRKEYIHEYHRNITIGYLIEMLFNNDPIINKLKH